MRHFVKSMQFGIGKHKLYGVYHSPMCNCQNQKSILLCSSIGPEYARPYRLLRLLAENLAKRGHHVFRFDWYGSGDSWGDSSEGNLEKWILDVKLASEELINISGNQVFSLIGLRFGATLGWLSLANSENLKILLLWEPVINGKDWVTEMKLLHLSYLKTSPKLGRHLSNKEILGYPFSDALINELNSITLMDSKIPKCNNFHIVFSGNPNKYDNFLSKCLNQKTCLTHEFINSNDIWSNSVFSPHIIISNSAVQRILSFFDRRAV